MEAAFREAHLDAQPIRNLGLDIEGTRLQPLVEEFRGELRAARVTRLQPRFYLSTEWGVAFGTIAIAIPFYLSRPELAALHAERTGMVEGFDAAELLRYLRHEMGHVVNYAYKLYERREWVQAFGAITQPYVDEYRPIPFSRRFVRHLPGWYAQKHPDEDWAETFAVWMTPATAAKPDTKNDWRVEYADRPTALGKLILCDEMMREIGGAAPVVTDDALDEPVGSIGISLDDFYRGWDARGPEAPPPGLDGSLRAVFATARSGGAAPTAGERRAATALLRRLEPLLCTEVYRWTGHFPERSRPLVRQLAERAAAMQLDYAVADEPAVTVALTALVTALAMNHVHRGSYLP
ncbi:MAG TPA: putative zinc-binding metallopeptidase [Polyangia bacterium]|nr:putative zinc-binding metallopeptidase [Polyangia bacterium]